MCVCVYNGPPVLGFGVLMGLSICVHVHGATVLGFGGFHSFDGPVHLCLCVYLDHQFWVLAVFTVLMGLSICVHVHGPTVLGFGGFHQWFRWAYPSVCVCVYMDHWFWVLVAFMILMGLSICVDHQFWVLAVFMVYGPVYLCECKWTNGFGFWQFSWF